MEKENKKYLTPELEVIKFNNEDIILTSGELGDEDPDNTPGY